MNINDKIKEEAGCVHHIFDNLLMRLLDHEETDKMEIQHELNVCLNYLKEEKSEECFNFYMHSYEGALNQITKYKYGDK